MNKANYFNRNYKVFRFYKSKLEFPIKLLNQLLLVKKRYFPEAKVDFTIGLDSDDFAKNKISARIRVIS